MKIAIVLGTRPEIIKMSPIIRRLEKSGNYFVIHTGQHYSYEMDKVFFEELELPVPKYNINVGSGHHGEQTGKILERVEKILMEEAPDIVFVQGDTNTVLGGALAAAKLQIKVGHVEAGLRSFDRTMPEEINRILTDHISDFLFCPTAHARTLALHEGIEERKIIVTGNTIVDAVHENIKIAERKSDVLQKLGIGSPYFLLTAHRPATVDSRERLLNLVEGLALLHEETGIPVVFPIHPRTRKMAEAFNVSFPEFVKVIEPVGFLEFLQLEANARLILTDSGGVQEEACILNVPCVTLRENTERPETIDVGANILVGVDPQKIVSGAKQMLGKEKTWKNPFGDGRAAQHILEAVQ